MGGQYYLTDERWAAIEPLLKQSHLRPGRPPAISDRTAFEGALYVLREGCRWRSLPKEFGPWMTVLMRYVRWTKKGVWWEVLRALEKRRVLEVKVAFLDSTTVRANRSAAGALKKKAHRR